MLASGPRRGSLPNATEEMGSVAACAASEAASASTTAPRQRSIRLPAALRTSARSRRSVPSAVPNAHERYRLRAHSPRTELTERRNPRSQARCGSNSVMQSATTPAELAECERLPASCEPTATRDMSQERTADTGDPHSSTKAPDAMTSRAIRHPGRSLERPSTPAMIPVTMERWLPDTATRWATPHSLMSS